MRTTLITSVVLLLVGTTVAQPKKEKEKPETVIPPIVAAIKAETQLLERVMSARFVRESAGTRAVAQVGEIGVAAIEPIAKLLADPSPIVRRNAILALAHIHHIKAEHAILRALDDRDAEVRVSAALHLRTITDATVRNGLIDALKDGDSTVRQMVVRQLAFREKLPDHTQISNIQRNELTDAVAGLARDPKEEIRAEVALTLGSHRNSTALRPLLDLLKDDRAAVRAQAATSLGQTDNRQAVPALIRTLADDDISVSRHAAEALGELKEPLAVSAMLDQMRARPNMRSAVAMALGKIRDRRGVEPLIGLLNDSEESVRWLTIESLRQIGDVRAVEPLLARLAKEPKDAPHIARALGSLNDVRAVEPLVRTLFADPDNMNIADAILDSVEEIRDPSVVRILSEHAVAKPTTFAGFASRRKVSRMLGLSYDFDGEGFAQWWKANRSRYTEGK